jgi:inhibitor of KinA
LVKALQPLGDQAILAACADEMAAFRLAAAVRRLTPAWLVDVVQAYTTVAIFFDPERTRFAAAADAVRELLGHDANLSEDVAGKLHTIPCCYELQLDLERVAEHTGLAVDDVVRLHSGTVYTVYAIGFCPGFPYLGYLPEPLCGVPRLPSPRLSVEPGSVGVTGRQTGIYTEARPGGWNLIARTPLTLVDVADGYFPLRTGDRVRFEPIDRARYQKLLGQRVVNSSHAPCDDALGGG